MKPRKQTVSEAQNKIISLDEFHFTGCNIIASEIAAVWSRRCIKTKWWELWKFTWIKQDALVVVLFKSGYELVLKLKHYPKEIEEKDNAAVRLAAYVRSHL
jgi:hypothetical protein